MTDERGRDLERRAAQGDAEAQRRALVERVRAGTLDQARLSLGAQLGDTRYQEALSLLGDTWAPPSDAEAWVEGMLGHSQEANARVLLAAIRPCLPALAVWLPGIEWDAARAAIEGWLASGDPAQIARLVELTESLGADPQYAGEHPPPGAEAAALSLGALREALRATLPEWTTLPPLPPPAPWSDPGHDSRFPREPSDARVAVYLFSDVLGDPASADDTAQCALESIVREYGGRYGTHLTQWARNCAFDADAVYAAVWETAYQSLGETIRAEVLPWCLGAAP